MLRSIMACLWVCAGAASARGQASVEGGQPPAPSGVLLKLPENISSWMISYDYSEGKQQGPQPALAPPPPAQNELSLSQIRRVTLTFSRPVWRAVVEDVEGRKISEWGDANGQYISGAYVPFPMMVPVMYSKPLVPNFGAMGFPDLDWVSKNTYLGVKKVGGHSCLVFRQREMTAWVDLESRYPVRWQRGNEIRIFQQLSAPQSPLTMPKEIEKLSQAARHDSELLKRPVPRGG